MSGFGMKQGRAGRRRELGGQSEEGVNKLHGARKPSWRNLNPKKP